MKSTIICIGNRFIEKDSAGLAVYDYLQALQPKPSVDIIEGGIAGLNLLPLLERGGRVIFIDAVSGFTQPGHVTIIDQEEILTSKTTQHHGHEAGLAYLLTVLPLVAEGDLPTETLLVGLEGSLSGQMIEEAANLSILIAEQGLRGLQR